ncbi:MAG: GNAT family N-acetyltransferase [Burkholderiales bacterium]
MLSIRAAEKFDAAEIAALYLASRKLLSAYAPLMHSDKNIFDWIENSLIPSGGVTVALIENKIIGMSATSWHGGFGWIDQLYIVPQHIGQGAGTALLMYALQKLPPPIRLYTFQANDSASRFYQRHGFVAIEFSDGANSEERAADILYEYKPFN